MRAKLTLPPEARFFDVVDAATRYLAGCDPARAVDLAYEVILGQRPAGEARAFYARLVEGSRLGAECSCAISSRAPRPVNDRVGCPRSSAPLCRPDRGRVGKAARRRSLCGRVVSGEAAIASRLLARTLWMGSLDFVRVIYRKVLAREVDAGGETFFGERLLKGSTSRAEVLRELLWSPELREG